MKNSLPLPDSFWLVAQDDVGLSQIQAGLPIRRVARHGFFKAGQSLFGSLLLLLRDAQAVVTLGETGPLLEDFGETPLRFFESSGAEEQGAQFVPCLGITRVASQRSPPGIGVKDPSQRIPVSWIDGYFDFHGSRRQGLTGCFASRPLDPYGRGAMAVWQ